MANALQSSIARLGKKMDEHKKDAVPMKVRVDDLTPYRNQARTQFPEQELQELAESIKEVGVLQPLLVRPIGDGKFEIVAGERRWRAAKMAGLVEVPVLAKGMDDATADKLHMAENIQRENLSTLDLAQRVQRDLDAAGGDLGKVAAIYNKQKPWVSKLSAIAQGGDAMAELVGEGVTSDRAVLAAVSSLERKAPERAKELSEQLKAAPAKANKRAIAEQFMKEQRSAPKKADAGATAAASKGGKGATSKAKGGAAVEPAWRVELGLERSLRLAVITVELSPVSTFADEFQELLKKHGPPRLAVEVHHPDPSCAIVQFGNATAHRRVYPANELRLLTVR